MLLIKVLRAATFDWTCSQCDFLTAQDDVANDVHTVVASRHCSFRMRDRVTRKESVVLDTPVANRVGLVLNNRGKVIFKRQSATRVFRSIAGAKEACRVHMAIFF